MKIEFFNTGNTKKNCGTWIYFIFPTIQISNMAYSQSYKYSIGFLWLNLNLEIKL